MVREERGQGLFELVATKQTNNQRDPDMNNSMSCSDGRWCTRADALLGVEGIHVSSVTATGRGRVLGVETGDDLSGCPDCGVVSVGHGRRRVRLHDIPSFGKPVMLLWDKRVWRCPDRDCPRTTFTEDHALAGPRAKLTTRAGRVGNGCPAKGTAPGFVDSLI